MPKGPGTTVRLPVSQKRKPNSPHIVKYRSSLEKIIGKSTAILSDHDLYVELEKNQEKWVQLRCSIIIEQNQGHFDEDTSCTQLDAVVDCVIPLS